LLLSLPRSEQTSFLRINNCRTSRLLDLFKLKTNDYSYKLKLYLYYHLLNVSFKHSKFHLLSIQGSLSRATLSFLAILKAMRWLGLPSLSESNVLKVRSGEAMQKNSKIIE